MVRVTKLTISPDGKRLIIEVPIDYIIAEKPVEQPICVEDVLTHRQLQVFRLVQDGLTSKEIGSVLGVSERTIKYFKEMLFKALDLPNTVELLRRYPKRAEKILVEAK